MSQELAELAKKGLIDELSTLHRAIMEQVEPLNDGQLWFKPITPGNSIGHLILHLTGNLNHYVGAQLGGSHYVRDREREFTEHNPPSKDQLLAQFAEVKELFQSVVSRLSAEKLVSPHPETRFGTVLEALVHLVAHFALHRGQISYLFRLVKN